MGTGFFVSLINPGSNPRSSQALADYPTLDNVPVLDTSTMDTMHHSNPSSPCQFQTASVTGGASAARPSSCARAHSTRYGPALPQLINRMGQHKPAARTSAELLDMTSSLYISRSSLRRARCAAP